MILPDEFIVGSVVAIGSFVAWLIRHLLSEYRETIERNTEAITNLIVIVKTCIEKE